MKLSCVFAPLMDTPDNIAVAEKLGFERAWIFDTPHQSPDVFMTLCRAAERTDRIGLGPGVLVSHLVTRGIPHTLIGPTSFADVIMLAAPSIQANSRWSGTAALGKNALIDSEDVVDAVVAVLRDPAKRGGRHVLSGPAGLTSLEVADALTETLGRPITYDEVSVDERRAQLEASGLDEWRVDLLLGIDEINRAELYRTPTDSVEVLTGHRPRTIHDYIARHRTVFAQ